MKKENIMTKQQIIQFIDEQKKLVSRLMEGIKEIAADERYEDFLPAIVIDHGYIAACEGLKDFTTAADLIEEARDSHNEVEKWLDNLEEHLKLVENGEIELTDEYFCKHMDWKLKSLYEAVWQFEEKSWDLIMEYHSWKAVECYKKHKENA